jgi:hypothetical protein
VRGSRVTLKQLAQCCQGLMPLLAGSRPRNEGQELGPRWVRAATVEHGHQRSPAVANGAGEPQVADRPAYAAGMMQAGESDCGSEGRSRPLSSRVATRSQG